MRDESLKPRAYAKLHADRYGWQEQQERAEANRLAAHRVVGESLRFALIVMVLGVIVAMLSADKVISIAHHAGWIG